MGRIRAHINQSLILLLVVLPLAQAARADVYKFEQVGDSLAPVLDILDPGGLNTSSPTTVIFNGSHMVAAATITQSSPDEAIDAVYAERELAMAQLAAAAIDRAESGAKAELSMPFSQRGDGWASLAFVDFTRTGEELSGSLANAPVQIVFAKEIDGSGHSRVWDIKATSAKDFVRALLDDDRDAPGEDLAGIGRYPGSKREMTVGVESAGRRSFMAAYSGYGMPASRVDYFVRKFEGAGLSLDYISKSEYGQAIAQLSDASREVTVFSVFNKSEQGSSTDIIQVRSE